VQQKPSMVLGRIQRDEHGDAVIKIPMDLAKQAGIKAGDYVRVEADEATGHVTITRVPIESRANYDIREVGLRVIDEERELLDRLAAYDRGEEP
jgi:anaerobic selenocysteine-containing dehydrogenase